MAGSKFKFTPPPEPTPAAKPAKSFMDHVVDTVAVVPRAAGMGLRLGSGALAAEGGPMGALIAGGGEAAAEGIEGLADYMSGRGLPDWRKAAARISVESGLGSIPMGSVVSKGRLAVSALKGAGLGAVGMEGRKWAQGESMNPKDFNAWDYGNVALGGALGAGSAKLGMPKEAPLSINPNSVPDAVPSVPKAAPPTPRPNVTKPAGLRVFTGFERDPATGQSVYTGNKLTATPEEHVTLAKKLAKVGPKDPLYKELGTNEADINPSHAQVEKRFAESQALNNKDAASDVQVQLSAEADKLKNAGQEAKNLNAGAKYQAGQQVQEARNLTARDKFMAKEFGQEARNLNSRDKYLTAEQKATQKATDDEAARLKIDQAKEGLVASTPTVSESTSLKTGPTTERVSTHYAPPPKPNNPNGGNPTTTTTPPPVVPSGGKTIYGTRKSAIFEAKGLGAVDVIKNPTGPGWIHVYTQESSIAPPAVATDRATALLKEHDDVPLNLQAGGAEASLQLRDQLHANFPEGAAPTAALGPNTPPLGSGGKAPKNLKLGGKLSKPMEDVKLSQGVTKTTKDGKIEQAYKPGATATPAGVVLENTQGKWNRKEFPGEPIPPEPTAPISKGKKGLRVGPKNEAPAQAAPAVEPVPSAAPKGRGKAAPAELTPEQLAGMTENERKAYFKKTAPTEDTKFALKQGVPLSPNLAAKWEALQTEAPRLPRGEAYRRLHSLQDEWRAESVSSQRASGEPALGTPEWQQAEGIKSSIKELPPLPTDPRIPPGMPGLPKPVTNEQLDAKLAGLKPLSERLKSEAGSLDPDFAQALLLHGGGALVGAGIGGAADQEHPVRGAIIGGAIGAGLPAAAKALSGHEMNLESIGEHAKDLGRSLPNAMRFNLLMDPASLAINVGAAPWGSGVIGSAEQGLTGLLGGDMEAAKSAGRALNEFGVGPNVLNIAKWPRKVWDAADEAKESIGRNERGELMVGEADSPTQKILALPGTAMTAGDIASRNVLTGAGDLSEEVARRITNTAEPRTPTGRKIANFGRSTIDDEGKKAIVAKMMLPFSRTAVNVVESGLERAPIIGAFLNFNPDSEHVIAEKIAQQGISAGVAYSSYWLGANIDPDTVKQYRINKLVSNMSGQYGLIASAAFAAGQAAQMGKDQVKAGMTGAWRELPLPTTQTPQDILQSGANILQGQPAHPNAEFLPQRWLPNAAVPGFLRDQFIDSTTEGVKNVVNPQARFRFTPPAER